MAPRRGRTGKAPTSGELTRADVGLLYVTGRDDLFRLAWLTAGDAAVAEDLVQEAYTRLFEHPERVHDADRADAYVRSIVLNLARTRFAQRSRRGLVDLRIAHDPTQAARPPDVDPMGGADDRTVVAAALEHLSPNQRVCVVARYWLGLSDTEIAEATGLSLGTAKTHLRRALTSLRRHFADEAVLTLEADHVT
ncbi:MAG TPA: RNA polymerase sigma factor [Acidimicrobiales bacterium]|nr:RNA polymerase sigma factor [Acidimicrobiales bacterium]